MYPFPTSWHRQRMALLLSVCLMLAVPASAQYVETLGPVQGITLASGTGLVTGGVGLFNTGAGTISLDIPAGASVNQVLLYWEGRDANDQDLELIVDGTPVTGTLIGLASQGLTAKSFAARADITGIVSLTPGLNTVDISGFDPIVNKRDGASIVVIIDDGSGANVIDIRDGADFAWDRPSIAPAEQVTVPQTFSFGADTVDRTAHLFFAVGDTQTDRPDRLTISVDGSIVFDQVNFFVGAAGPQWSNRTVDVTVPAGATQVTAQVFSGPGRNPESLTWIVGGFSIEAQAPPPPPGGGCTFTQGYWKNHEEAWPVDNLTLGTVNYTQAQLLSILKQPVRGNGLVSLSHQLIAAKLNTANGADDTDIASAIADADALIGGLVVPPVGGGYISTSTTSALNGTLTGYNEGSTGPGHCDDFASNAAPSANNAFLDAPQAFELHDAYPNPFTAQATLRFSMPEAAPVRLAVYDVMGREVAVLVDGSLDAGEHRVPFAADHLAAGTYLYRLVTPQGTFTRTMMLVR